MIELVWRSPRLRQTEYLWKKTSPQTILTLSTPSLIKLEGFVKGNVLVHLLLKVLRKRGNEPPFQEGSPFNLILSLSQIENEEYGRFRVHPYINEISKVMNMEAEIVSTVRDKIIFGKRSLQYGDWEYTLSKYTTMSTKDIIYFLNLKVRDIIIERSLTGAVYFVLGDGGFFDMPGETQIYLRNRIMLEVSGSIVLNPKVGVYVNFITPFRNNWPDGSDVDLEAKEIILPSLYYELLPLPSDYISFINSFDSPDFIEDKEKKKKRKIFINKIIELLETKEDTIDPPPPEFSKSVEERIEEPGVDTGLIRGANGVIVREENNFLTSLEISEEL